MGEVDWREQVASRAAKILPDIISQTPVIGEAAKELLAAFGYDQGIADKYFTSLLRNLSKEVDKTFLDDGIGLEGGLAYAKSGNEKSNFIVSRPVAAYLHSITDPDQKPLPLKSLVVALLHERMWQCKDSAVLYDAYSVMPLYEGVTAITRRLQRIVSLAIEIRNNTLQAISKYEPAAKLFEMNNSNTSIYQHMERVRSDDVFSEADHAECIALSTCPILLIEKYIDLFANNGKENIHYIPYIKPFEAPDRDHPPMLRRAVVIDENSTSPGLAIENVVRIRPFAFLDMAASQNDDHAWPYGREVEAGFINLLPPFDLWCDHGSSIPPRWMEKGRVPDVVGVVIRNGAPTNQDWDEYVQSNSHSPD